MIRNKKIFKSILKLIKTIETIYITLFLYNNNQIKLLKINIFQKLTVVIIQNKINHAVTFIKIKKKVFKKVYL